MALVQENKSSAEAVYTLEVTTSLLRKPKQIELPGYKTVEDIIRTLYGETWRKYLVSKIVKVGTAGVEAELLQPYTRVSDLATANQPTQLLVRQIHITG